MKVHFYLYITLVLMADHVSSDSTVNLPNALQNAPRFIYLAIGKKICPTKIGTIICKVYHIQALTIIAKPHHFASLK